MAGNSATAAPSHPSDASQHKPFVLTKFVSGFRRILWSCRDLLSMLWGSGRWALVVAIISLWFAYIALRVALWTTRKDFLESCLEALNANQTLSSHCIRALEIPLPPPPLYGSSMVKRAIGSITQSRRNPAITTEAANQHMDWLVTTGAYLVIGVSATTIALLSIILVIRSITLPEMFALILSSQRQHSGDLTAKDSYRSPLNLLDDELGYVQDSPKVSRMIDTQDISAYSGLTRSKRSDDASKLRRRYPASKPRLNAIGLPNAAKLGDLTRVASLVNAGAGLNEVDEFGKTAMHRASENGHYGVVQVLLNEGVHPDPKDSNNQTPLSWAAASGHYRVVQILAESAADLESRDDEYGRTPLFRAVKNRHAKTVSLLLEAGANVEAREATGWTPLHQAAWIGHLEICRILIDNGAEINAKDANGGTALHGAAWRGSVEVAGVLLRNGADIEAKELDGGTALHRAAWSGRSEIARLLLDGGANIEAKTSTGETPLHAAASSGSTEVIETLLQHGADIRIKDKDGKTAVQKAADGSHHAAALLLMSAPK